MESHGQNEVNNFIDRSVLVLCGAGTDRSKLIALELESRGYHAIFRGVNWGTNLVTLEDLEAIGHVVFSSIHEKKVFDAKKEYKKLRERIGADRKSVRVLNITEDDKNKAIHSNNIDSLKGMISNQLDQIGFDKVEGQYQS